MYSVLDISTSALQAYRTQMDVIAGNFAMKESRDEQGNPYRRRVALFAPGNPSKGRNAPGVHVAKIVEDTSPLMMEWNPGHVDAIKSGPRKGYVYQSNVNYHTEMVNAITASRAYEANVTVMEMSKRMVSTTLRLLA